MCNKLRVKNNLAIDTITPVQCIIELNAIVKSIYSSSYIDQ